MEESILVSIKKLLGIAENYTQFDADIIMHINSVFCILTQLGVRCENSFCITGGTEVWSDFISNSEILGTVKTYTYLRVRLLFDPPQNSSVIASIEKNISELEWRINAAVDFKEVSQNE